MTAPLQIGHRHIGAGHPCYIIAEISANHGQDFTQACRIVAAAHAAGADAVKLQTYTADTITLDCRNEYFQVGKGTIWEGRNLHDLYQEAYTPWEWQPKLKAEAERLGIPVNTLKTQLHRARQRHAALIREVVAETVSSPLEVEDELRHLLRVISAS